MARWEPPPVPPRRKRDHERTPTVAERRSTATPLDVVGAALACALVFGATATLKLSAAAASALHWALNALSWAASAASVVASFGSAATLGGLLYGCTRKWTLEQFVAW